MSRQALLLYVACALTLALLPWRAALGQVNTGTVTGTVRDPSGAVVTGANVTAKNVATGAQRTTTTGNVGQYNLAGLPVGTYEITVNSGNFAPYKTNAEVTVGGVATVDAQLGTAAASTTVEVVAGAGGTEVNTQTQEVSQLVDTQQLANLPSLTRNPYDFIQISGNVSAGDSTTPNTMGSQNLTGRGTGFAINGQRMSGTEVLLDGVENIDLFNAVVGQNIPVDSVQEYRVITNNFDSQYGRAAGGVVNLTTKSGTNSLHGSVWEFNRLSAYTANTYANDAQNAFARLGGTPGPEPAPKGAYTRNQFGFAVGGPLVKDKLFFFGSTEWTRVRSNALETEETLDPAFLSMLPGNVQSYFSSYGTHSFPASGAVTAGELGTLPAINGTTAIPASTPVFDIVHFKAPFDAGGDQPQNTYRLLGRFDFNMTDRTQMFFRFGRENEDEFNGTAFYSPYPQYDVGTGINNNSGLFSINHSFSSGAVSNTKLSFSRLNTANTFNTALTNTPSLMLFGFASDPVTGNLIQFPGLENIAPGLGGLPFGGPQNTLQAEEDLAVTKGAHTMRFGGQLTYIQLNKAYGAYAQAVEQLGVDFPTGMAGLMNAAGDPSGSPLITFSARANPNGALPCVANPAYWSTNDLVPADSLDGLQITPGCTVTPPLSQANYARSYRYWDWAFYAQDSWKLTPRFTFNYGARYEHYGVQRNNVQSLDSNFYFGSGQGLYQQVRTGQVLQTQKSPAGGFWAPDWGTIAPRIGFAWDVFGDGRTSLRGGAGISYERNFGNVTFNASFNPPASAVISDTCPVGSATCGIHVTNNDLGPFGTAGPALPLTPAELRMPDPRINTAQTQFWSLDVQRQLARNTVLDIGYNGAHGVHLYDIENINLLGSGNLYLGDNVSDPLCATLVSTTPNPTLCYTRANNQYSNINMRGSLGNSFYSALNVRFQTQNLHNTGLALVANYTWAHSLDDLSSTFSDNLQGGSGAIGNLGYTNVLDPKLDWGSSDFDVRHRFVVSPVWETPWLKTGKGFLTQALGGWTISAIYNVRTGVPFSIFDYSNDLNFYTVPRLTPMTPITSYKTGSPTFAGPNLFNVMNVPVPAPIGPLNPTLGISDFGPYPANMTHRNAFRGPGAWNTDAAVQKTFKLTERVGLTFRAEGFDVFNHHNLYVNTSNLDYSSQGPGATLGTGSNSVTAEKGGLGSLALGGNHDERRFGQFSLRVSF
ncbi:MAG TPA: carboxypeptidase regulatory-like domain-containing protein [Terriglobales bacterium]